MSTSNIEQLFGMLVRDPNLSPAVQQRIYTYAAANRKPKLLVELVQNTNLTPGLDAAIGTNSTAEVKAAWVSRQGRPIEVLSDLARTDSRAAVLVELASRTDLPTEVYAVMGSRGFVNVNWALVENPSVPDDVLHAVVAAMVARSRTATQADWKRLATALKEREHLHETLVSSIDDVNYLAAFGSSDALSVASYQKLVAAVMDVVTDLNRQIRQGGTRPDHRNESAAVALLDGMAENMNLPLSVVRHLLDGICPGGQAIAVTVPGTSPFSSMNSAMTKAIRSLRLAAEASARELLCQQATETESVEELASLGRRAVADTDRRLGRLVVLNPNVTAEIVEEVRHLLKEEDNRRVMRAHRGNIDIQAVLLAEDINAVDDEVLAQTGDPHEMLIRLVRKFTEDSTGYIPAVVLNSSYFNAEHASELPITALWYWRMTDNVRGIILDLIVDKLGTDQRRWEVFESFIEDPPGRLGVILDTVRALVPDAEAMV